MRRAASRVIVIAVAFGIAVTAATVGIIWFRRSAVATSGAPPQGTDPSHADVAKRAAQSVRKLVGKCDLAKDLRYARSLQWYHQPCYQFRTANGIVTVGADDLEVYGLMRRAEEGHARERSLELDEAVAAGEELAAKAGVELGAGMKLTEKDLSTRGGTKGQITLRWQGFSGDVELPQFFETRLSTRTGEIMCLAMCKAPTTVSLIPALSFEECKERALRGAHVPFDVARCEDRSLTVWIMPDGTQHLCRIIDLYGPEAPPMGAPVVRATVDAHTGEVLSAGQTQM